MCGGSGLVSRARKGCAFVLRAIQGRRVGGCSLGCCLKTCIQGLMVVGLWTRVKMYDHVKSYQCDLFFVSPSARHFGFQLIPVDMLA